MIAARAYKDRKVAVYGLGASGLAVARALLEGDAQVTVWDDGEVQRAKAETAGLAISDPCVEGLEGYAALILAPGIPLTHPEPHQVVHLAQQAGVPVLGDVELFQHEVRALNPDAKIVAITGTNGKSTTTALIGHMITANGRRAEVGGNIGKAVFDLEPPRSDTVYVIEVSSYQIDLAPTLRPDVGVLLNITPDHIDRHGTLEHYASVKARLFQFQGTNDVAIIGIDDDRTSEICSAVCGKGTATLVPVSTVKSLSRGVCVLDGVLYDSGSGKTDRIGDLKELKTLAGLHNWQNAAVAYAAGRSLGFPPDRILHSFRSFPGLAHRMEIVAESDGVLFVNDSKATNAEAAGKALGAYDTIFWIAGGVPKEGGIASLAPFFPHVEKAYLIGEAANAFGVSLEGEVEHVAAGTLDAAVAAAARDAVRASREDRRCVVLLSPACASFDQFKNFEVRGDAFREMVHAALKAIGNGGEAA
ncbi:UDP-N-acetylmuramoyl-L-alanine--D-glutamate ligase [Parvibaculaceae bacterium PLY_AMNH_Bact1]|nr:UDP-N-acetylmuramoyl-L-alanine--D-glutamate ligase [Parvibaculaceae bacterium PLY_AMNH_Bact1]